MGYTLCIKDNKEDGRVESNISQQRRINHFTLIMTFLTSYAIYKLSSFPSPTQISQNSLLYLTYFLLLLLLLNLEFVTSYSMAKILKLRFTTEVAPPKFISITRRPLIKTMDTIDEDKAYASLKNDVNNVDRQRYLLQASSPFEWYRFVHVFALGIKPLRELGYRLLLRLLITCCLSCLSSSQNQPAFYGQWRCWFLLLFCLFCFVLFCFVRAEWCILL